MITCPKFYLYTVDRYLTQPSAEKLLSAVDDENAETHNCLEYRKQETGITISKWYLYSLLLPSGSGIIVESAGKQDLLAMTLHFHR